MSEITEKLKVAIADRYVIEREDPALKRGLGARRRVVNDAGDGDPSGYGAVRRIAAEPGLQPRNDAQRRTRNR